MNHNLLTVCLITYNHSNYITNAIESVLMQETNFKFQLVIADDCSTDGSKQILLNFKDKYPETIHLILQETNVGPAKNWMDLLSFPQSKYIAYFEGDDYWTDPKKLQKQVDLLESNNDVGLVYTKSSIEVNGKISSKTIGNKESFYNLYVFNFIPTLTVMFRSCYFKSFRSKFHKEILEWRIGDYPLWLWIYTKSKIKFLDSITAAHRVVIGSESNKGNRLLINQESFKISSFFLKKYNIKESFKVYLVRRFYILLVCIKYEPKKLIKVLKSF